MSVNVASPTPVTGSENVAVTVAPTGTPVAVSVGDVAVMVGGVVSGPGTEYVAVQTPAAAGNTAYSTPLMVLVGRDRRRGTGQALEGPAGAEWSGSIDSSPRAPAAC